MKKIFCFFFTLTILLFCFGKATTAQCWHEGDVATYTQSEWSGNSSSTTALTLLETDFNTVYASTFGTLIVGGGFTMYFGSTNAIKAYLPQTGPIGPLDVSLSDPTFSVSGELGGDVVTLKLNIDFADAGYINGSAGVKLGDLIIYNSGVSALDGISVRNFLVELNKLLGGGTSSYGTINDLQPIALQINNAFIDGTPSTWAQQHLRKGWKNGDFIIYTDTQWGNGGAANSLLLADYGTVYAGTGYIFKIGSAFGFTAQWTDPTILATYLPGAGTASALTANLVDPTSTPAGVFGSSVATLKLNIDFADAGFLNGTSGIHFGDLVLYGFTTLTDLNGLTVRQFLGKANTLLSGGIATYTIADINIIASELIDAFYNSTPNAWAQLHLKRGWQNGDLTTYGQAEYGSNTGAARDLLINHYDAVYASTGGQFIIGSQALFYMQFDGVAALLDYFPQTDLPGALDGSLFDPTNSSSGYFGGDVAALKVNIDFSDAGFLSSNSGLKFGDLTICGLTSNTGLNGMTVRQLLDIANNALGGGSTPYAIADLDALILQVNASFDSGMPSTWSQLHLVNGSCDCNNTVTNQCPAATAMNISTTVGTAIKFKLQGSDADNNPLTYSISQGPTHGTATIAGGDSIIYTPNAAYHGTDQLKYKVSDGSCDAEATVDITIIVCPQGPGYWKNHADAWPVSSLLLGTTSYTKSQLITILNTPVGNGNNADASLILADQLIAAKLSLANGSPAANHLNDSIAAADALIGTSLIPMKVKPNSVLGKKMISLATFFANYNNGSMTQGCRQAIITRAINENEKLIEVTSGPELKASPNPSYNNFALTIRSNNQKDQVTIEVIDMYGRIIEVRNVAAEQTIQVGDKYRPGIYFVKFMQGEDHKLLKLIKL